MPGPPGFFNSQVVHTKPPAILYLQFRFFYPTLAPEAVSTGEFLLPDTVFVSLCFQSWFALSIDLST